MHGRADIGVEVDGEQYGGIVPLRDRADRPGNRAHPLAEILAPVGGDADDPLACKALGRRVQIRRKSGLTLDRAEYPVERIDHRVAGDVNAGSVDILAS